MKRMTRVQDEYTCRANECYAEDWMKDIYGKYPSLNSDICEKCPFANYINRLAEYEDEEERIEDDLK